MPESDGYPPNVETEQERWLYDAQRRQEEEPIDNIVEAKVYLVEHGYQIDVFDYTKGKEPRVCSVCRDFGDNYPIGEMANTVAAALLKALENVEESHQNTLKSK